ncbi:TIGR02466 family protein [Verrucomicrobiota bacterium sgz303538]
MISHLFTTPILREPTDLTIEQLAEVRDYLLSVRRQTRGEDKSNRGGWHSSGNLFNPTEYRTFPILQEAVTQALFRYIGDVFNYRGEIQLSLTGWTVINRRGDYNAPHNHAANLLSGAFYITVPPEMRGGEIVFQDPRLNLNAHETSAMRQLGIKPLWMSTQVNVAPAAGDILVFPSWLMHYVEPFQSDDPEAVRIVVSFNATVE